MISDGVSSIVFSSLKSNTDHFTVNSLTRIEGFIEGDNAKINWDIEVEENAKLDIILFDLFEGAREVEINVSAKSKTDVKVYVASLADNMNKHFNIKVYNNFGYAKSLVKMYGLNKGSAKFLFDGTTSVKKGAKKCDVRQDGRIINFSSKSRSTVSPKLLVGENDVKASHGAVVGFIDSKTLFYLMSRGLSTEQALSLYAKGSFMTFVDKLSDEGIKCKVEEALGVLK